ncbi:MDR family MFS transporter [Ammoniphilus resinae]|uniref:EmrB/QacA subfamily drug resistance transporter n=1 Tax=Ammoniphilus resinae TaxID=861532 RepID=A0ABS4GUK7_9BACL|nr:MDR family MFS transporter [Ammoniphilus resinae]MBP1933792.1 EmrB/QacA subfamily drug resistance transporter [Ammoniphilus resinae]
MNTYQRNITIALLIATFLSAIEVTIVSTAMPVIVNKLGGMDLISWVFAVYLLTSAVTTPIFGKLSDLFGRKMIFMVGVSLFLLGSALCGFSQTMEQLIWFRALQGIGAGALMPTTFTIIGDIFDYEQRAKVQGLFSAIWGIAGIFGPLVGGFFVDYLTWHWIFFINIPFGLVSMLLLGRSLKESSEKKERIIDYSGALTFTIGMTALLYALLSGGNEIPWNSKAMYFLFGVALVFLALFIRIQLRHPEPMVPLGLFKYRDLAVSNLVSFFMSAILIGLTAYLPLWIQGVLEMGATSSGLTLTPMSLGWPIGAVLSGRLLVRLGARSISLLGTVLVAIGSLALALVTAATANWVLVVIMFFVGLGFGLSFTVFTVVVQSAVGWNMRGAATSSNTFLRILGQTLGIAVLGTVLNQHIGAYSASGEQVPPDILAGGLHMVFVILAGIAIVSALFTGLIPKHKPQDEKKQAS